MTDEAPLIQAENGDVSATIWQAQRSYAKSRDLWLEQHRQGKLLPENSGEPNRLSKEIEKCVRALVTL